MSVDFFSALADPTRRRIVEMLAGSGDGLSASEIHEQFSVSPQAISQHLKILRESNWALMEKRAQQRIYRINPDTVDELESWAQSVRRRWNLRLDALDAVLQEEKKKTAPAQMKEENKE